MSEWLTRNFKKSEYHCRGCDAENPCADFKNIPMDLHFAMMIQELRDRCGFPLSFSSAYRCPKHNATIPGAAPESYHTLGLAVDIWSSDNVERRTIVKHAIDMGFADIGIARTFIHLDGRLNVKPRMRVY